METLSHATFTDPIIVTHFDKHRLLGLIEMFRGRSLDPDSLEELELELERADTVEPWNVPADVVTMNSIVEPVVFPGAANAALGRVSILAPVGRALLGARQGARVECPTPGGIRRVVVDRISFQPEANGKFNL
jgi:regulator of nucleoside diphosphate kinase